MLQLSGKPAKRRRARAPSSELARQALGVRIATRSIVRELGFMKRFLAGTELTPSQAHVLLEIQSKPDLRAAELTHVLRLDKSAISRLVSDLVSRGHVVYRTAAEDRRSMNLRLSATGRRLAQTIQRRAQRQIVDALAPLSAEDRRRILEGLALYADALRALRKQPPVANSTRE
jgi:DNA-binding MarR family transcriptional regulator